MSLKSIKNNIFLYSLSLSNYINYIFYFPFILLYLFNNDNLSKIYYIQIYIFFIIYDLTRNLSSNFIRKISNCFGINRIISINLIILLLISFLHFLAVFRSFHGKSGLNTLIILRIIISLVNITPIFTSKIIVNIFGKKEMYNKLSIIDFYEKLNTFLIFVFIYFITPSKFPLYFLFAFVYNLYFLIIYLIFFKCQDEKNFILYEEKTTDKIKSANNQSTDITKKHPKKKFSKRIKNKEPSSIVESNNFSKSGDKGRLGKRKSSAKIINNEKILEKESNENYFSDKNNENGDIENNMIVLTTTNNNQQITNKDYTNNDNNSQFQKQNIYMVNNIPIVSSSQRVFQEKMTNNSSIIDLKNDTLNSKKKNIFIYLNLIPNRFLIFLFLFMLYSKTISLKNIFSVETHLLFYIGYFFIIIPIDALTNIIYAKTMKNKNSGKKILLITSCALSIISIICYIYLFLNSFNQIKNKRIQFILYVLFFVLNLFLKEGLIIMMRIFYKNSMNIGFSRETLKKNKEISNIFACLLFLGYNISLLFINNPNSIFDKIVYFIMYYFLPIFFLLIIFIINAYIS